MVSRQQQIFTYVGLGSAVSVRCTFNGPVFTGCVFFFVLFLETSNFVRVSVGGDEEASWHSSACSELTVTILQVGFLEHAAQESQCLGER